MTTHPIRAVYNDGQLRLLDPVELSDGEEIQLMILSEEERVLAALGDLLVKVPDAGENVDDDALAREVEEGFRTPLSDAIIEERRRSP